MTRLIIRNVTGTNKGNTGTVVLTAPQWCALCDALNATPEITVADLVGKAEKLTAFLSEARRKLYQAGLLK